MNAVSRTVMDAYYLGTETMLRAVGFRRPRVVQTAAALGMLRSWIGYVGPRKSRRVFLEHMANAVPEMPRKELNGLLGRFWFYHQLRFLDLFTVDRLPPLELEALIHYDGLGFLDAARSTGAGAIAVTLHVGDARIAHVALGLKGYPVHLLSARYDDYGKRAREARLRSSRRYHAVHFLDEPLRWAHRQLAASNVVFMAISGYGGSRGHPQRFLNEDIAFSSAPARLAMATRAPVVPVVDLVDRHGLHHVRVHQPLEAPQRGEALPAFTHHLVRIFEGEVLRDLAQLDWIWYVIRCQEHRGEVPAYEEGAVIRARKSGG
ncbi:hypothetical protein JXA88_19210 [Candidatus Fermentibacteria bacterium]|nr:hypothetical protein [Candidatus Fermentibacteria bacterium]